MRKLAWHHDSAHLSPEKRLLDIGCGWGANVEYQAVDRGVKEVQRIMLSRAQQTTRSRPSSQCSARYRLLTRGL